MNKPGPEQTTEYVQANFPLRDLGEVGVILDSELLDAAEESALANRNLGGRRWQYARIGGSALAAVAVGFTGLHFLPFDNDFGPSIANAEHDKVVKNTPIEKIGYVYAHPMSGKEVWSYGVQLRNPLLGGANLVDTGMVGEVVLTGKSDVGVDVRLDPKYLADYQAKGARAAIWVDVGPNDHLVLMDQRNGRNEELIRVEADNGFAGILLPEISSINSSFNSPVAFGLRVVRVSGHTRSVVATFGNISKEDAVKPLHRSVIDVAAQFGLPSADITVQSPVTAPAPEVVAVVEPLKSISRWNNAQPYVFFRPESSNGVVYSQFLEFAVPSSPQVIFGDRGNVGEFIAFTKGASGVKLEVITHPEFVSDLRGGKESQALWLSQLPKGTRIRVTDMNGYIVSEARTDDAGFGGVELPGNNPSRIIVFLDFGTTVTQQDVIFQMGGATRGELDKGSTAKLSADAQERVRILV